MHASAGENGYFLVWIHTNTQDHEEALAHALAENNRLRNEFAHAVREHEGLQLEEAAARDRRHAEAQELSANYQVLMRHLCC